MAINATSEIATAIVLPLTPLVAGVAAGGNTGDGAGCGGAGTAAVTAVAVAAAPTEAAASTVAWARDSMLPHFLQKRANGLFSSPQEAQRTVCCGASTSKLDADDGAAT